MQGTKTKRRKDSMEREKKIPNFRFWLVDLILLRTGNQMHTYTFVIIIIVIMNLFGPLPTWELV